jgi:RNase P subunit RPR2
MRNFVKREKMISDRSGVSYDNRARADLEYMRYGSSFMLCDECKVFLGLWHCVRYALFKKQGSEYVIPCKRCAHHNLRVKGALNAELSDRWTSSEKK